MGQLQDAFMDAAGEVASIKAQPSNRYWWLYGTIKAKNKNGTLDVAIDGATIQQVKATVSCMMANVGDRVIVLKAGPLMTCVDVIATSDEVSTNADSIEGTISADNLPVATRESLGVVMPSAEFSIGGDGLLSLARHVPKGAHAAAAEGAAGTIFSVVWDGKTETGNPPDLNDATPGLWIYNTDTNNRPSNWGVCLVLWTQHEGNANSDWKFQLAFPTGGGPKWRRNINRAGWSSWLTMNSG